MLVAQILYAMIFLTLDMVFADTNYSSFSWLQSFNPEKPLSYFYTLTDELTFGDTISHPFYNQIFSDHGSIDSITKRGLLSSFLYEEMRELSKE